MRCDIVCPKGNEHELIAMAKRLGYDALCLLYESPAAAKKAAVTSAEIALFVALPRRVSGHLVLARSLKELSPETDILLDIEPLSAKDAARTKTSGLTAEVVATLKAHGIALGFSLQHLLAAASRPALLARIQQNIRLAKKVPIVIASFASTPLQMRSPEDLRSLYVSLGLSTHQAKEALALAAQMAQRNTQFGGKAIPGVSIGKI